MVLVALTCALVGNARVFGVKIDDSAQVWELKKAIKAEKPNDLKYIDADKLQLCLAKTEKGAWLLEKDPGAQKLENGVIRPDVKKMIDENKMMSSWTVEEVLNDFEMTGEHAPSSKQVHVLVVVHGEFLEAETVEAPHPRKRRWDKLNEVLDKDKKAKKAAGSTGFSSVSFPVIDSIMPATKYRPTSKPIPDEKLDAVHRYFPILIKAFGDIITGKEAKRLHFIVPVLASVCALFDGGIQILAEETVVGKRVHGDGAFEFVLKRGEKCVCIVEAKRDDFQQGLAQAYVGSEALADVEGLPKVYSIVTNFLQWVFSRSLDDKIERATPVMMVMENDVPAPESVKQIAGMIYSILSEDN